MNEILLTVVFMMSNGQLQAMSIAKPEWTMDDCETAALVLKKTVIKRPDIMFVDAKCGYSQPPVSM